MTLKPAYEFPNCGLPLMLQPSLSDGSSHTTNEGIWEKESKIPLLSRWGTINSRAYSAVLPPSGVWTCQPGWILWHLADRSWPRRELTRSAGRLDRLTSSTVHSHLLSCRPGFTALPSDRLIACSLSCLPLNPPKKSVCFPEIWHSSTHSKRWEQ